MNLNVIVDTREKKPWNLTDYSKNIDSIEVKKLDTGDYSLAGLEKTLCIERKRDVSEVAMNLKEDRFKDFLERMGNYKYKYLLLEATVDDVLNYPVGSLVPKKLWKSIKMSGAFILSCLTKMQTRYGIQVIYCGSSENAIQICLAIMKQVSEFN